MLNKLREVSRSLVIPFFFILPIILLYIVDPDSFNYTWKGRTFYLFFLWLLFLELILAWEKITQKDLTSSKKLRIVATVISASVPFVYVLAVNFLGLNSMLIEVGKQIGAYWPHDWPLSLEYLVFTIFFAATIWLAYEVDGLKQFSISLCLLGAIGAIYMIDVFYPYGAFTPFQVFVPLTASSAARVLNWMGYTTSFLPYHERGTLVLTVSGSSASVKFGIAWPCAGVQSLFIYTCVILLFLKKSAISMKQKIIYFIIGAIGTYVVNILRIVSIYVIALNQGDWLTFHNYYGELYSITWIIAYIIIIVLSRAIPAKLSVLKVKLRQLRARASSDDSLLTRATSSWRA